MVKKSIITIPFEVLPESRSWQIGRSYRAKVVLRQIGMAEQGADFEVIDATSLEPEDKSKRHYLTDGGYLKG